METGLFFLFALFSCAYAQYMSSWGSTTGYTNQMHAPIPYMHTPYHHVGVMREVATDGIPYVTKSESVMPIQLIRAKVPARVGVQDYSVLNLNALDHEEMPEHTAYRQTATDIKRPVLGVISLLQSAVPLTMGTMGSMGSMGSSSMGNMGNKYSSGYQDSSALDELMTCVGMDGNEPMKVHSSDPRIIVNRGYPYYVPAMHKIK